MVNLRAHLSGVPRTFSERRLFVVDVAAECGIALGLYSLVEFSNRSLQRVDRHLVVGGNFIKALIFLNDLLLEQLLEHAGTSFLKGFEVGLRADSNSALAFTL